MRAAQCRSRRAEDRYSGPAVNVGLYCGRGYRLGTTVRPRAIRIHESLSRRIEGGGLFVILSEAKDLKTVAIPLSSLSPPPPYPSYFEV